MPIIERHTPVQQRSRERRARLVEATAELIATGGYDAVSTRSVAEHAAIPIATLYRYFADKDDLVAALAEHHVAEMDARVAAVSDRSSRNLRGLVEDVFAVHVDYFDSAPSWVSMWFRGRSSPTVERLAHERNARLAATLISFAQERGLVGPAADPMRVLVAIEAADRVFELAYREDPAGDRAVLAAGLEMVCGYIERFSV